jgi:AcrR family transcriptional regulator
MGVSAIIASMARESKKRTSGGRVERHATSQPSARSEKTKARAAGGRSKVKETASTTSGSVPESDRAPGRGKYDRTRTPDQRNKEQLHRLLDAAGLVFAEMGWADATVEAIVTRAGMSRRTFYEHFDDLKDCLQTFHQRATRQAFKAVEIAVGNAESTKPGEQLRTGVTGFLDGIRMFPHVARVIFRVVRSAGPEFEAAHEQMMSRFGKLVYDGVEAAHAAGHTELPPDELRVFALVSAMEAVAMRYVLRGEESQAIEAAPVLINMVQRVFGGTGQDA